MRSANPAEYGQMPSGDANMGGVLSALGRSKFWIAGATLLAFAAAAVFVNVVKPKYTGEAKVLLENRENYFTRPDREQRGSDPVIDAEAVQSQVQMIMSRDLAINVIQKLDLASSEEFDPVKKEASTLKRILSLLGVVKDPFASSPDERILESYMDKLLVYNLGKSRVISVEFSSRDPELAAKGANLIADEYIRFQRDAKKSTTQGASAWLAQAIEPLRAKVADAENKVEAYRSGSGLLIGASNATIATQQLGEMNTQMSAARAAQSELQAKSKMIREALRTGRVFETSEVVNNELVRRLLEQRVSMKTQIALEERTLLPGHPRMKELQAQVADLEGQIRTAAERTARTLENDARVAGARVQSIQADFESQKRTASDANGSEVQLRALEREARALRDNYESYLAKYRDALSRDADAASPADARVVSRAVVPQQPTFPKKMPVILLATLATLILSCAIVITRQVFSTQDSGQEYGYRYAGDPREASHGFVEPNAQDVHFDEPASASPTPDRPVQARNPAASQTPQTASWSESLRHADVAPAPVVAEAVTAPTAQVPVAEAPVAQAPVTHEPSVRQPAPFAESAQQPYVRPYTMQAGLQQTMPNWAAPPEVPAPPVRQPAPPPQVAERLVPPPAPVFEVAQQPSARPHWQEADFETAPASWSAPVAAPPRAVRPPVRAQEKAIPPAQQPELRGRTPVIDTAPSPVAERAPPQRAQASAPEPNDALAGLAEDLAGLKTENIGLVVGCHSYGSDVFTAGTAMPLARVLSRLGSTVVVDLTGTRDDAATAVGQHGTAGVTDLLASEATFGECIHRDRQSKMHIIPFGESGLLAHSREPFGEPFLDVLDALVQTYDFVVLDAGPIGGLADSVMYQSGAIVMISSRDDSDPAVARVFQRLDAIRPGCVTIVVEEPVMPPPRPANDRYPSRQGVA